MKNELTVEEANLFDRVTSLYKLPLAVESPTTIHDCEPEDDNEIISVEKGVGYLAEAMSGNEDFAKEKLSPEEIATLKNLFERLDYKVDL